MKTIGVLLISLAAFAATTQAVSAAVLPAAGVGHSTKTGYHRHHHRHHHHHHHPIHH